MEPRSRASGISFKDAVILVLLLIIVAQSYWLSRSTKDARKAAEKPASRQTAGKIAIIVDDSGYSIQDCDFLKDIAYPVTVAILPELAYSRDIAACARQYHKDVILHLPLEPHQTTDHYREGYIITSDMSPAQVKARLAEAIASVPFIQGINNHMGSRATENRRLMALIFDQIQDTDLFFVDSRVTSKTICAPLAGRKNIPFAERDVFLDNRHERGYIEGQFQKLAQEAREKGYAIGIGHARPLTWKIIKEQTEKLSKKGFEIVPVEELVK